MTARHNLGQIWTDGRRSTTIKELNLFAIK